METIWCDACQRRTLPNRENGTCPGCGRPLADAGSIGDVSEENKTASLAVRSELSPDSSGVLEDPIFEVTKLFEKWTRRFLGLAVLGTVVTVAAIKFDSDASTAAGVSFVAMCVAWAFTLQFLWLSILWRAFAPSQATDVFYLRSFRNDADTWPIRVAIQDAIGPWLRLSGIRDPQRRALKPSERYAHIAIAMKYSTPRHMDLEAGADWKSRLWYSMQGPRIAVLDISDATECVMAEISIAAEALGTGRMICVGRVPQTEPEIRTIVGTKLGSESAGTQLKVLIWPGNAEKSPLRGAVAEFKRQVKAAIGQIQTSAPVLEFQHCPSRYGTPEPIVPGRRKSDQIFSDFVMVQFAIIAPPIISSSFMSALSSEHPGSKQFKYLVMGLFLLVNLSVLIPNWLIYIFEVGVPRERIKAAVGFAIFAAIGLAGGWVVFCQLLHGEFPQWFR